MDIRELSNDLELWDVPVEERLVSCAFTSELQCGICLDLLKDPCQCINGHLFCMVCILECIERKAECPQCRCQLSENSLSKSLFVRKYIDDLLVHCRYNYVQPFHELEITLRQNETDCTDEELPTSPTTCRITVRKCNAQPSSESTAPFRSISSSQSCVDTRVSLLGGMSQSPSSTLRSCSSEILHTNDSVTTEESFEWDPKGCPEQLKSCDLEQHELRCSFAFVRCRFTNPFDGAREHYVRRLNFEEHLSQCHWRPFPCKHCGSSYPFAEVEDHEAQCHERPMPCQYCREVVRNREREGHERDNCPEIEVSCPFSSDGCDVVVLRKDLASHLKENMLQHLLQLQQNSAAQRELIERQTNDIKGLEEKCQQLSTRIADLPKGHGLTYFARWEVDKYSQKRSQGFLRSPQFTFCGITWYIAIYPNASPDRSHISLYLFVARSDQPTSGVHCSFEFTIVNKDPVQSKRLKYVCNFPLPAGDGWGGDEAIAKDLLTESAGFLQYDVLTIHLHATVDSIRVL